MIDMNENRDSLAAQSRLMRALARRPVRIAIIWAGWTLIGCFFAGQMLVAQFYMNKRLPTGKVFFMQMSICYLWALATPLVLFLARRFPIGRQNWATRLGFHLTVGLVLVSLMSAVHYVIFMPVIGSWGSVSVFGTFQYSFYNLDRQLCIYWLFVL